MAYEPSGGLANNIALDRYTSRPPINPELKRAIDQIDAAR
jgi:hypothetical protein